MPFSLERDSNFEFPLSPTPNSLKAHISSDSITLETDLDLDYWEVDPAWDGKMFKSALENHPLNIIRTKTPAASPV